MKHLTMIAIVGAALFAVERAPAYGQAGDVCPRLQANVTAARMQALALSRINAEGSFTLGNSAQEELNREAWLKAQAGLTRARSVFVKNCTPDGKPKAVLAPANPYALRPN